MEELILYNNEIVHSEAVHLDIEDRGYQFGDGIYEVLSVYKGEIFRLDDHLERFQYGTKQIGIQLPFSLAALATQLKALVAAENLDTGQIYFQITRGYAPRNHMFPSEANPVFTGYVMRKPRNTEAMQNGGKAVVLDDIRWLRCDIKSISLLGSVMLKQQAFEQGALECILHRDGIVTEAGASNFYIVKDGAIWTHPLNHLILGGVTRKVVLEIAAKLSIPVIEEPFTTDFMGTADEAFISGTVAEIVPIIEIDQAPVGRGVPGEITRSIQMSFNELIDI